MMAIPRVGFPFLEMEEHFVEANDPEHGAIHRGRPHKLKVPIREITLRGVSTSVITALFSDFETARGPSGTTTMTHPRTAQVETVQYMDPKLPRARKRTGNTWDLGPFRVRGEPVPV